MKTRRWYNYLWIYTPIYLVLGLFNILFAWLGMIEFIIPLVMVIFNGNKRFCNVYCSRGQLFNLLGNKLKLSRKKNPPKFLSSKWFRYGFLVFFMTMFVLMIVMTVNVFLSQKDLQTSITILWSFKVNWMFAYHGTFISDGVAQFAFGMYGMMLTSNILGFVSMVIWKPRTWCVYCPMGTMTQGIATLRRVGHADEGQQCRRDIETNCQ